MTALEIIRNVAGLVAIVAIAYLVFTDDGR